MWSRLLFKYMVIGVVGKIGSGKSYFIEYVKDNYKNVITFSCDTIAKKIMDSGESEYTGKDITPYIFFTNEAYQEEIRNKLHPIVFKKIEDNIQKYKNDMMHDNYIFLIESALPSDYMLELCDKLIYIKSDFFDNLARLKENRGYSDNQAKLIFDSQKFYEKFYDKADYIIDNNSNLNRFKDSIKEVMNEICIIRK